MAAFGSNIYDPLNDEEDKFIKDIIARALNAVQDNKVNDERMLLKVRITDVVRESWRSLLLRTGC